MNDLGEAIGALPKAEKEPRRTVRVNVSTMGVYPPSGRLNRIGTVLRYTERQGARTPTGGIYTAHRLTVRLRDDDRNWVGQISKDEMSRKNPFKTVTIRQLKSD